MTEYSRQKRVSPWLIMRVAIVLALFEAFVIGVPKYHTEGGRPSRPPDVDPGEWSSGRGPSCSMTHE